MSCNLSLHPRNKHAVAASPLLPQLVQSAQSCHAGEEVSLPLTLPPSLPLPLPLSLPLPLPLPPPPPRTLTLTLTEEEHALALAALCTDASLHARLGA
jgi:hypothetical protein